MSSTPSFPSFTVSFTAPVVVEDASVVGDVANWEKYCSSMGLPSTHPFPGMILAALIWSSVSKSSDSAVTSLGGKPRFPTSKGTSASVYSLMGKMEGSPSHFMRKWWPNITLYCGVCEPSSSCLYSWEPSFPFLPLAAPRLRPSRPPPRKRRRGHRRPQRSPRRT